MQQTEPQRGDPPREHDCDELEAARGGEQRNQHPSDRGSRERGTGRHEPGGVDRDGEERREEVAPGDVRPVPRARREEECDEDELRCERDDGRCWAPARDENADEHEPCGNRERVGRSRERDERVLRAQTEDIVDERGSADVRRTDDVVRDSVRASIREQRSESLEIATLVEPGLEHLGCPTAHRKQEIEAEPEEWERAIEHVDDPGQPRRWTFDYPFGQVELTGDRFDVDHRFPVSRTIPAVVISA